MSHARHQSDPLTIPKLLTPPEAARACADSPSLLAIDERRRAAILASEQAQARRNAASKEIAMPRRPGMKRAPAS